MRISSSTLLVSLVTHILISSVASFVWPSASSSSSPAAALLAIMMQNISLGDGLDLATVRSYHKLAADLMNEPSSLTKLDRQRTKRTGGSSPSLNINPPIWLRSLNSADLPGRNPPKMRRQRSSETIEDGNRSSGGGGASGVEGKGEGEGESGGKARIKATTTTTLATITTPSATRTANETNQPAATVIELTIFQAIQPHYLRHSPSISMIMIIAYTIVFLVGIVGNSFVVAIVCKSPRMRTVTNYFIVNLALADILVLLFCLPATLIGNLFIPYLLGLFVCKTVSYLQGVAVSASINTMVAVTMDRFLAICFPMDWHMSRRAVRWTIACIWLFSLSISLPWAIYFNLMPFPMEVTGQLQHVNVCAEDWPSERIGTFYFVLANLIFCYVLPAVIIILCYLAIWYKIQRRNIPGDRPVGLKIELIMQKSRLKVVKMMMAVVIIFLLSWLPLYLIFARIKLVKDHSEWEEWLIGTLMPLAQWLGASNSCINPILYTIFNRKYKRGFVGFLRYGFCCKSNGTHLDTTSTSTVIRNSNGPQDKICMKRLQQPHQNAHNSNQIQIPLRTLDLESSRKNLADSNGSSTQRTTHISGDFNSSNNSNGTQGALIKRTKQPSSDDAYLAGSAFNQCPAASGAVAADAPACDASSANRHIGNGNANRFSAQTNFVEASSSSSTVLQASWSEREPVSHLAPIKLFSEPFWVK